MKVHNGKKCTQKARLWVVAKFGVPAVFCEVCANRWRHVHPKHIVESIAWKDEGDCQCHWDGCDTYGVMMGEG